MMVKKTKATKQQVPSSAWSLNLPPGGIVAPGPGAWKEVRERFGLSQPAIAQESGVSRNVIANYESGRTKLQPVEKKLTLEQALKVWRVLEVKERALNIPQDKLKAELRAAREEKSEDDTYTAREYLLGLLWYAKTSYQYRTAEIDGQVNNLKREQEIRRRQVAEIEGEESSLRADGKR
jgi:transcriptional regulator with XRE-family HTH domain